MSAVFITCVYLYMCVCLCAGAVLEPAVRPADAGVAEEGGEVGEQPQTQVRTVVLYKWENNPKRKYVQLYCMQ